MTVIDTRSFLAEGNVYLPHLVVIEKIIDETPVVRTFHFNFKDKKLGQEFTFESGQFAELSIFGIGEATFCISSRVSSFEYSSGATYTIYSMFSI